MKIGIIGANGKQGRMLCREAMSRGHNVCAIIRGGAPSENVDRVLVRDLFSLERQDIEGLDVLISAFGSGFDADPSINRRAIDHLIEMTQNSGVALQIVGGAGSLFTDSTHTKRVYELPEHPAFLKGISENMAKGLSDLQNSRGVVFTYVCPSLVFDFEGERKGEYKIGDSGEVIYNSKGESRISYADYAAAMIDEAERGAYRGKCITVCEV
ncbi:MAG: NAD(P)-dependent oxidoreductase [Eubacteriales bacterium]